MQKSHCWNQSLHVIIPCQLHSGSPNLNTDVSYKIMEDNFSKNSKKLHQSTTDLKKLILMETSGNKRLLAAPLFTTAHDSTYIWFGRGVYAGCNPPRNLCLLPVLNQGPLTRSANVLTTTYMFYTFLPLPACASLRFIAMAPFGEILTQRKPSVLKLNDSIYLGQ